MAVSVIKNTDYQVESVKNDISSLFDPQEAVSLESTTCEIGSGSRIQVTEKLVAIKLYITPNSNVTPGTTVATGLPSSVTNQSVVHGFDTTNNAVHHLSINAAGDMIARDALTGGYQIRILDCYMKF